MKGKQKSRKARSAGKPSRTKSKREKSRSSSTSETKAMAAVLTEDPVDTNSEALSFLSDHVDMHLILRAGKSEFGLIGLECQRLPWLGDRTSVLSELRDFIESDSPEYPPLDTPEKLRGFLSSRIESFLESYDIRVATNPRLTVEEHSRGAAKLASQPEWLSVVPYKTRVISDSSKVPSSEVSVILYSDLISLGPDNIRGMNRVTLRSKKDFFLERIELALSKETLASIPVRKIIRTKQATHLKLPVVPLKAYDKVRASGNLQVVLVLPKKRRLQRTFKCSVPDLAEKSVAMFVDLGSSYVKTFRVDIPSSRVATSKGVSKLGAALEIIGSSTKTVKAWGPEPTARFTEAWELPEFRKSILVSKGSAAYTSWLISCARTMSAEFLAEGKAISSLHVSLPRVAEIDPLEVQMATREATDAFLLDTVYLVPEHEALRERFGSVLMKLNGEAKREQQKIGALEQKKRQAKAGKNAAIAEYRKKLRRYEKRGWLGKLFRSKPKEPDYSVYRYSAIPKLAEWRKELLDLKVDPNLSEVLILDAGGYSLDAYARIGGKEYGQSFPAGGNRLTELMRDYTKRKWKETLSIERAESKKKELCSFPDEADPLQKPLLDFTTQTYQASLDEVLDWVNSASKGRSMSIPMLLTGGGFNNPHLFRLVCERLIKRSIKVMPFTSIDLVNLIEKNNVKPSPIFNRFIGVTYGFDRSRTTQQISFDICGGMIEQACVGSGKP